jgi:hypothetical protein
VVVTSSGRAGIRGSSRRTEQMAIDDTPQTRRRFLVAILGGAAAALLVGAPETVEAATGGAKGETCAVPRAPTGKTRRKAFAAKTPSGQRVTVL